MSKKVVISLSKKDHYMSKVKRELNHIEFLHNMKIESSR